MSIEEPSTNSDAENTTAESVAPESGHPAVCDEFDISGWTVPVICKDCSEGFTLPYRLFQAGVVFHCPHCRGSFVPTLPMYRAVRDAFANFYDRIRNERDNHAHNGGDKTNLDRIEAAERISFRNTLDELARKMRPAGKLTKPKGLGAMFT